MPGDFALAKSNLCDKNKNSKLNLVFVLCLRFKNTKKEYLK